MRSVIGGILVFFFCCSPSFAQVQRTFWGVSGGFTPKWEVPSTFKYFFDADSLTFEGNELQIGFVRSSVLGGDWGVSYVRKNVSDSSTVSRSLPSAGCPTCGVFFDTPDAWLNGIEIHKFAPFGTIKERVQIGMNFAGGIAKLKGTVRQTTVSATGTVSEIVDAETLIAPWGNELSIVPLGKVEFGVTVIAAPDLKIRASGGFDFPGYRKFGITAIYLFGAR